MDKGYILVSRNLLESDVFASQKLLKIWIWCLCKANFKDKTIPLKVGKGETIVNIKRGSFLFGRNKAEDELFIDGSTIYKSIKKLEEMDMINIKSNNQYSIITINNYDTYQDNKTYKVTTKEQPSNNQVTSKEQPSNTTNTLTNDKNVNNEKKVNRTNKFVPPTLLEVEGYFLENGYTSESGKKAFNYYNVASWKDSTGKQVKNWKQKMQSVWFKDENKIEPIKKEFNYKSVRGKLS